MGSVTGSDGSKFNLHGSVGQVLVRRRAGEETNLLVVSAVKRGDVTSWYRLVYRSTNQVDHSTQMV